MLAAISGRFSPERMCRPGCDYAGDATGFADSFLRFAPAEEAALEGGSAAIWFVRSLGICGKPRACGSRILIG